MTTTPSYRPFSNGCEFLDWHAYNCEQCTKGPAPDLQGPNEACDIENAFALASVCGGTINDEAIGDEENARKIAERLRWNGSGSLPARCSEFLHSVSMMSETPTETQTDGARLAPLPSRRFRCLNCGAKCRSSKADRGTRRYCRPCESMIEWCYDWKANAEPK